MNTSIFEYEYFRVLRFPAFPSNWLPWWHSSLLNRCVVWVWLLLARYVHFNKLRSSVWMNLFQIKNAFKYSICHWSCEPNFRGFIKLYWQYLQQHSSTCLYKLQKRNNFNLKCLNSSSYSHIFFKIHSESWGVLYTKYFGLRERSLLEVMKCSLA